MRERIELFARRFRRLSGFASGDALARVLVFPYRSEFGALGFEDVVADRVGGIERRVLREPGDSRLAIDDGCSRIRGDCPDDAAKERAFSRSVFSDESGFFTLVQPERDIREKWRLAPYF